MINADELKRLPFGTLEVTFWNGTPAIAEVGTGRVVICNAMTANQETRRLQGIIADEGGLALLAGFVAAVNALPELLAIDDALRDYHFALDTREHGGVAASKLVHAIEAAFGRHYAHGAERALRAALKEPGQ
jgi:hypothetical protein